MQNRNCKICNSNYTVKYPSSKVITCSKSCKNVLARQITKKQFDNPKAKELASKVAIKNHKDPLYRAKFLESINNRRSYKGANHPGWQVPCSQERKDKIGEANRGRFKGKTWEEMYGLEMSKRRRIENSLSMAKINAALMTARSSEIETKVAAILETYGFLRNYQIGSYTVDLVSLNSKLVIEIYGDYWHCNPILYKSTYFNKSIDMSAEEKWLLDFNRVKLIREMGYKVIIFWEKDLLEQGLDSVLAQDAIAAAIADWKKKQLTVKK